MNSFETFTLTPMTAGDIIDRAVRLYRRNFLALLRIVLAPSLVAYVGLIIYYIGVRNFSLTHGDRRITVATLLIICGGFLWITGKASFYAVLGGASRSLVFHFFDGTPLRARDVFRAVRERLWPLIGATFMVLLLVFGFAIVIYFAVMLMVLIYIALLASLLNSLPYWLQFALNVVFGLIMFIVVAVAALLVYSRMVYIPQVLMVEGKGVLSSISRSFSLAGGEVRRIAALIMFWFYVAWSLWLLLLIPLGWYGYWVGVNINPFSGEDPLWYDITQQTLTQLSEILIAPIAMLGFTLLYLDSRVTKEGFDVELLANRVLPPPPPIPQPRVSVKPAYESAPAFPSILGLSDYRPAVSNAAPVESGLSPETGADSGSLSNGPVAANAALVESLDQAQIPVTVTTDFPPFETPPVEPLETGLVGESLRVADQDAKRVCRWCDTEADVEDRFCRVCGSVF